MSSSAIVAAALALQALLLTGLSLHVSRLRLRHRVSFGDGGHRDLLLAIRAHGNALEQTALFAALALALAALPASDPRLLAATCTLFVAVRCIHAVALFGRRLRLRQVAHGVSTLVHLILAGAIAWTLHVGA